MSKVRRMYLLIHTPTHMGYPVQMGFVAQADWSTTLFKKYLADVKRNRDAGYSITQLSKRSIEDWGFCPPCGARVQVMEIEIPKEEWIQMWNEKKDMEYLAPLTLF